MTTPIFPRRRRTWILGGLLSATAQIASMLVSCSDQTTNDDCFRECSPYGCLPTEFDSCTDWVNDMFGQAGAGGDGGENATDCEGSLGLGGACGVCEVSIDAYCADADCTMPERACWEQPRRHVYWGCGYRKVNLMAGWSDEPPLAIDVWDEASGELLYHSERIADDASCTPVMVAGAMPDCDDWTFGCDSGYSCPAPPHWECLGCVQGCLPSTFSSCAEWEAVAGCGKEGAGGQGGFGGGEP